MQSGTAPSYPCSVWSSYSTDTRQVPYKGGDGSAYLYGFEYGFNVTVPYGIYYKARAYTVRLYSKLVLILYRMSDMYLNVFLNSHLI